MQRSGFTVVEVVVALTLLTAVLLSLVTLTGRTMQTARVADAEQAALQLVTDRTDQILTDPRYRVLDSIYVGVERGFPTMGDLTRTTLAVHVQDALHDYKRFTVIVQGALLRAPIARTVSVAAP
jgi:Tfp pilus assembly protein PilV